MTAPALVTSMKHHSFLLAATLALCPPAWAQTPAQQADSFANIYATTCLKYLSKLDALRTKLAQVPSLPPEKASQFLKGQPGKAWPVPDKHGTFVLAIPDGQKFCAVYARRVGAPDAVAGFQRLVATAPAPLTARLVNQSKAVTPKNGVASTMAYEWSVGGASPRLLFMLTTADSPTADIQGLATANYVQ